MLFWYVINSKVLVLGCEHAAPLPSEALESLVRVCRSLLGPQSEHIIDAMPCSVRLRLRLLAAT